MTNVWKVKVKVGPRDYTVHGILQARILEWVAVPFSRGSSQPRDRSQVSHIVGRFFTSWATREAQEYWSGWPIPSPGDLPDPGIKMGSPALQADSLPAELLGKPNLPKDHNYFCGVPENWPAFLLNFRFLAFPGCSPLPSFSTLPGGRTNSFPSTSYMASHGYRHTAPAQTMQLLQPRCNSHPHLSGMIKSKLLCSFSE